MQSLNGQVVLHYLMEIGIVYNNEGRFSMFSSHHHHHHLRPPSPPRQHLLHHLGGVEWILITYYVFYSNCLILATYCWEKKKAGVNKSHRRIANGYTAHNEMTHQPPNFVPKKVYMVCNSICYTVRIPYPSTQSFLDISCKKIRNILSTCPL